jgi:3-deoxy-manno-octulosonate cytidylyltransferase (CMP-KDO synthetase)
MIEWVYSRASQAFDTVSVATDDERIFDEVKRFGGSVVMTSPLHDSGTDRCAEALVQMQAAYGEKADVVVNIQGDEPFADPSLLVRLSRCFDNPAIHIATVVKALDQPADLFNPNCVKAVTSRTGRAIYFSRSPIPCIRGYEQQEWLRRHTFYRHLGLYAYRADALATLTRLSRSSLELAESLEQNRWLENDFTIQVIQTDREAIAIDTPDDLLRAQEWLAGKHLPL